MIFIVHKIVFPTDSFPIDDRNEIHSNDEYDTDKEDGSSLFL